MRSLAPSVLGLVLVGCGAPPVDDTAALVPDPPSPGAVDEAAAPEPPVPDDPTECTTPVLPPLDDSPLPVRPCTVTDSDVAWGEVERERFVYDRTGRVVHYENTRGTTTASWVGRLLVETSRPCSSALPVRRSVTRFVGDRPAARETVEGARRALDEWRYDRDGREVLHLLHEDGRLVERDRTFHDAKGRPYLVASDAHHGEGAWATRRRSWYANGNLRTDVSDMAGREWAHRERRWDACGRPIFDEETGSSGPGGTATWQYDAEGRLVAHVGGSGDQGSYRYESDRLGRVVAASARWPEQPPHEIAYRYDDGGHLVAALFDGLSWRAWRWDAQGRLVESTASDAGGAITTRFTYDGCTE